MRRTEQNKMSIPNALAMNDQRDNGFENMTTDQLPPKDGYKKGGVVKPKLGAKGMTIKGPGTGTSDSIDADLPVGSAIIPASVLKLYGEDFFDKLEAIAHAMQSGEEKSEPHNLVANINTPSPQLGAPKKKDEMKCGGIAKMKDGGIVPAKVSNGERYMRPNTVKFFGQKFVNTLIHAKPDDVKEEMGEVKGGKVHAAYGFGVKNDSEAQARINKMTGVDRTPVNIRPMSKEAVDMTSTEQARPNIKGNPPSNVKFGQGQFDPNLVHDERAQTLSERRNQLNKTNRAKLNNFSESGGGVKSFGGVGAGLLAADAARQAQASPLVQKGYGNAQANLEQQYGRKLPMLPGTMNDKTESVMNKAGELMNTNVSDLADKGKRFINTNYPNAVSDAKNAGNRIVDDFNLGVKGIASNLLGANSQSPTTQVKNVALPTISNQPVVPPTVQANQPVINPPTFPSAIQSPPFYERSTHCVFDGKTIVLCFLDYSLIINTLSKDVLDYKRLNYRLDGVDCTLPRTPEVADIDVTPLSLTNYYSFPKEKLTY